MILKKDVYVYQIGRSVYVNLTNRCCNRCLFCLREYHDGVGGYNLWLWREPSAKKVIALLKNYDEYDEVVFCGFGEPMYRLEALIKIAQEAQSIGKLTRLNTNGLGNLIHGRDVTPYLRHVIDTVSISLNAADGEEYNKLCRPKFQNAFEGVLDFAYKCSHRGIKTILSVVDIISDKDIMECERIAQAIGAGLRVRELI